MQQERLHYTGHGGGRVEAWVVRAQSPDEAPPPGVLLIHDVFGLDAHLGSVAERLGGEGYAVLAPDLYSREGVPGLRSAAGNPASMWSAEQVRAAQDGLPDRRVLVDLEAALVCLEVQCGADPERLAAVGLGLGGTYALLLGCTSIRVGAVVDLGGDIVYPALSAHKPIQPLELLLNLSAPLLCLFGERDLSTPPQDVDRLRRALRQFGKSAEVHVLEGAPGGFFNDTLARYDERAANRAWELTLAFLRDSFGREA